MSVRLAYITREKYFFRNLSVSVRIYLLILSVRNAFQCMNKNWYNRIENLKIKLYIVTNLSDYHPHVSFQP